VQLECPSDRISICAAIEMMIYELPVALASAEVEIEADIEAVWKILSSINSWPDWNADIKSASLQGEMAPGSVFVWKAGPMTINSRIYEVHRPYALAWTGTALGIRADHKWRLERRGKRTWIKTEECWEGLFPRLFRWPVQRMLQRSINSWLSYLKREGEGRTGF